MKKIKAVIGYQLSVISLLILLVIAGCSTVKISKTTPTGTVWSAEYNRWFNQKIDGFFLDVDPNGAIHTGFASQLSDTQIAFKLGQMSVGVGGTQ